MYSQSVLQQCCHLKFSLMKREFKIFQDFDYMSILLVKIKFRLKFSNLG